MQRTAYVDVVILGQAREFKNAIQHNQFGNNLSTIGVDFCVVEHNDVKYRVFDTCGQERFTSLLKSLFASKHAFILVNPTESDKSLLQQYNVTQPVVEYTGELDRQIALDLIEDAAKQASQQAAKSFAEKSVSENAEECKQKTVHNATVDIDATIAFLNGNDFTQISKDNLLAKIRSLPAEEQIDFLIQGLNQTTALGKRFWKQEGNKPCDLYHGTLNKIRNDLLKLRKAGHEISIDVSSDQPVRASKNATFFSQPPVISFEPSVNTRSTENATFDDKTFNHRL